MVMHGVMHDAVIPVLCCILGASSSTAHLKHPHSLLHDCVGLGPRSQTQPGTFVLAPSYWKDPVSLCPLMVL
jgi:hypothetical protein